MFSGGHEKRPCSASSTDSDLSICRRGKRNFEGRNSYTTIAIAAIQPPAAPLPAAASSVVSRFTNSGEHLMSSPFVIDLYHGDNVQDTPGPLGGFARVKASGIAFLIHKASEGLAAVDSRYQARRAAWMNGVPVTVTDVNGEILQLAPRFAAYHFLHGQDPEGEARHFLATAQLRPGDDAVVDWEQVGATGFQPSADAVDAFCNVVERARGFPIIVYSGNVAKEQLKGKDPRFAKRRLWLAQYSTHFTVQESWASPWLWQNNGDQMGPGPSTIPGIDGFCDNSTIVPPMTIKRLYAEWGGGQRDLQASPEALQQLRQHVDSVLAAATAPAAAASPAATVAPQIAPAAAAGPAATVAPQIAAEQDFCSLWPTAKPVLQAVGGIVGFIPGVGAGAGPVLNSLVSVGDQIYNSTCKE
jgi:GH25 family lysozyme M1 (1,4-beta-N-acetylmuramidase)